MCIHLFLVNCPPCCSVQVALILSGNLSFLNWLTILPAIFCFDDLSLRWLFSSSARKRVTQLQQEDKAGAARPLGGLSVLIPYRTWTSGWVECIHSIPRTLCGFSVLHSIPRPLGMLSMLYSILDLVFETQRGLVRLFGRCSFCQSTRHAGRLTLECLLHPIIAQSCCQSLGYYIRQVSNVGMALLLAYLSIPVVRNLLSSHQVINTHTHTHICTHAHTDMHTHTHTHTHTS